MKKPLRILHIEDSERDVTSLSRYLEESGYQLASERVETADDMNAALASSKWDIILCNYSMPRFDALSALNVLRKSGLDIPFLIISGTIGEDIAVKALLNGANDYILKDDLTRLKPSIERELLQAKERRAKRKTEDALKASEAELRALFAAIDDIVIVFDYDGRHLKVAPTNPKYFFKHGTNRIGKTVHEIYPPDFAHFLLTNIQTCLDESRTLSLEYSFSIDGSNRWFNSTVTPMTNDSAVWVARDNTERKRAEEALRESNEKFHQLADNLTDVFWIRSRDMSKIHYISPAYEKIWGRSLRDDYADPQEWQGYIVPDDQQRVKDAYASLMDDAPNIEVEFRIVRPDNEIRWVRARGFQVRDNEGNIIRLAGIVTDITESRHSNEALAASEKRFRSVVETAPDVIVTIDDENTIYFINPAAEKTFGYSADEIKGASLTMLMPEGLRHMHEAGFQRYLQSGVRHVSWNLVEARGLHKSGREIPITISFSEYVQDGRRYFTGIIRDISDRKQAMEALQKSEERYRELVENALDIIYTHDLKGNYTSANKAAETITGYTNAEALALNMADTIRPEQVEKARKMIAAKLAGENITAYELELIAKDGHTVPVEVNTRIVYVNGVAVGVQGIARDITARKLAEKKIELTMQRLNAAQRLGRIGDWEWNVATESIEWSSEVFELTGRDPLLGAPRNFDEMIAMYDEPSRDVLAASISAVIKTGTVQEYELDLVRPDGERLYLQVVAEPKKDEDGRVVAIGGTIQDISGRKLAEAALIESESRYHSLFENMIEGYAYCQTIFKKGKLEDWVYTEVNRSFEKLTGLSEVEGKNATDLIPGIAKFNPELFEIYGRVALTGVPERFETYSEPLNSWLAITVYSSSPDHFVAVFDNITERKLAEKSLAELTERTEKRERMLTTMLSSMSDFAQIYDSEGRIMFVNQAVLGLWGRTLEDVVGKTFHDLDFPEELAKKLLKQIAQVYRTKKPITDETPFMGVNGTPGFYEYILSPAVSPDGRVDFVVGSTRDVTERKAAEAALKAAEENYRSIFENAVEGICQTTLEGRFISANPATARILGFDSPEELIALRDIGSQHYVDPATRIKLGVLLEEHGVIAAFEAEVYRKDGSKIWTQENVRAIRGTGGRIHHYEGSIEDITARKSLEDQLRQSQKMEAVGVMAGGIAHDFNNLLTAINGYSDLTLSGMSPDDPLRRNIEEIQRAGERAAELTSQLLAFSRKQVLKPVVHNLNSVIKTIEKMLRRIIPENIELRTVLDADLGNIIADPGQVEQVIMNLAVNARDAMPAGGTLTIETHNVYLDHKYMSHKLAIEPGPFVRMTVSDTGTGIDASTQQHIFEPFFTTKEVGKGTGLGLSMVYGIVKQSGGDVLVYSEPGHGSTFKIYLPRVDKTVEKQKWIGDRIASRVSTETVLLVEDEEVVRNLVREILTGNGYNVLEASSGDAALAICKSHSGPIHLLLTDVIMPRMGGREVKEEVVKLYPDIKVLFMSGYTDDAISHGGIFDSAAEFIEKPFTPSGLIDKIRGVLEH